MSKEISNAADGVVHVFRGLKKGVAGIVYPSPLLKKVGKSQMVTITGRS